MTLTIFCLMVFALFALQVFMGQLRNKCVKNFVPHQSSTSNWTEWILNSENWFYRDNGPALCGNASGARMCPENYVCLQHVGENPNFGYTSFDNLLWSMLTTFQLITLDYWENVYNMIVATGGPVHVIFFTIVVFFGSFYLINLMLAVVAMSYEEEAEAMNAEKLKEAEEAALTVKASSSETQSHECTIRTNESHFKEGICPQCSLRNLQFKNENHVKCKNQGGHLSNTDVSKSKDFKVHKNITGCESNISFQKGVKTPGKHPLSSPNPNRASTTTSESHNHYTSQQSSKSIDSSSKSYFLENQNTAVEITIGDKEFKNSLPVIVSIEPGDDKNCEVCSHCCLHYKLWLQFQRILFLLVHDVLFDSLVTICIIANTTFLALEHHGMSNELKNILDIGNKVFTTFFTLEAILKLIALSKEYFASGWNIFDLIIVFASLIDLSVESINGISVLRGMRLMRVLKLAQSWTTMKVLLSIILSTLGALGNLTFLLIIVIYIFAVLGMQLFGQTYTAENFYPEPIPRWNFTDFFHSFMMIFRILCGEWVEPLWDCMRAEEKVGVGETCLAIFLPALVMGNFMVLNLFLALLLNSFNSEELKSRKEEVKGEIGSSTHKLSKIKTTINTQKKKTKEAIKANLFDIKSSNGSTTSIHKQDSENKETINEFEEISQFDGDVKKIQFKKRESNDGEDEEGEKNEEKGNNVGLKTPQPCFPTFCTSFFSSCCIWMNQTRLGLRWLSFRQMTHDLVDNPFFEWTILLLIFASSLSLCFEDINLANNPDLIFILKIVNLIFAFLFGIEMILKWIAFGLWIYFSSMWSCLDFVIVFVSILSLAIEGSSNLTALRSLRTLRALRPLRAISRWQGMKIVVNALMYAIPSIFNVLLVCLVFWLIFSIMGVQIFGGKFYKCVDDFGERFSIEVINDRMSCMKNNYTWINSKINFDHVGHAYLALFQVATFEGWMEVMADAVDARDVDEQPQREANLLNYVYFIIFIVCGSFFTLNLFIGVIIDNFNALKKKYEGGVMEMFLTESQKNYYTAMKKLGRKKPQKVIRRPKNEIHAIFYDISLSRRFEIAIFILIFLNMISMGIEHYDQDRIVTFTLEICNALFTTIFSLEALVKIIGLRFQYFTAAWNLFDFILVIASITGIVMEDLMTDFPVSPTLLRVVRVFRIGRILRLIKAAKGIRKLLFALMVSLPALFNIGALLTLITFIYAIIGMTLFGHVKHTGVLDDQVNFETFGRSMQVLFRLVTSAGWNDVLEPLLISPPDCDPLYKDFPNGNCGHPFVSIIYFVSFIIINFMIVINMYIAIILENFNQAHQEEEIGIIDEDLEMFYTKWSKYDPHATQFIHFSQISDFIATLEAPLGIPKPNTLALVSFNLPIAKGDKIHCLDVLHALTKYTLGFVDDGSDDFKKLTSKMDDKFKKEFPTRKELEIVSSTQEWKTKDNAARVLQRFFRVNVRDGHSLEPRIHIQTQTSGKRRQETNNVIESQICFSELENDWKRHSLPSLSRLSSEHDSFFEDVGPRRSFERGKEVDDFQGHQDPTSDINIEALSKNSEPFHFQKFQGFQEANKAYIMGKGKILPSLPVGETSVSEEISFLRSFHAFHKRKLPSLPQTKRKDAYFENPVLRNREFKTSRPLTHTSQPLTDTSKPLGRILPPTPFDTATMIQETNEVFLRKRNVSMGRATIKRQRKIMQDSDLGLNIHSDPFFSYVDDTANLLSFNDLTQNHCSQNP